MPDASSNNGDVATLLGRLARCGVIPEPVAMEILGAYLNDGRPRFSRFVDWLEDDSEDATFGEQRRGVRDDRYG